MLLLGTTRRIGTGTSTGTGSIVVRRLGARWLTTPTPTLTALFPIRFLNLNSRASTRVSAGLSIRISISRPLTTAAFLRPSSSSSPALRSSSSSSSTNPSLRRTMATSAASTTTTPANGSTNDPNAPGAIDPEQANTSGVTAESLQTKLSTALNASHVDVQDISGGCGQSFAATIVSSVFEGKMTLARHRLVNAAVKQDVAAIHAWTPKCLTPAEWEKKQAQG